MRDFFKRAISSARTLVQKWWRPLAQLGLVGTIWTQGVILPIMSKSYPDLVGLSALITSIVAAFAVRTYEKRKGMPDGDQ